MSSFCYAKINMMMGQDMEQIKAYLAKKGIEPGDLFPS